MALIYVELKVETVPCVSSPNGFEVRPVLPKGVNCIAASGDPVVGGVYRAVIDSKDQIKVAPLKSYATKEEADAAWKK